MQMQTHGPPQSGLEAPCQSGNIGTTSIDGARSSPTALKTRSGPDRLTPIDGNSRPGVRRVPRDIGTTDFGNTAA